MFSMVGSIWICDWPHAAHGLRNTALHYSKTRRDLSFDFTREKLIQTTITIQRLQVLQPRFLRICDFIYDCFCDLYTQTFTVCKSKNQTSTK